MMAAALSRRDMRLPPFQPARYDEGSLMTRP